MLKRLKKSFLMTLALTAVMPVAAQDLIANQAPIDRKLRAVDSIQLNQLLESEVTTTSPAAQLYDDWNNQYVGRQTTLPDSFLIDLRDFAMPSPSRNITSNFGPRWGRQHKGLDIKLNTGDTIVAAFSGKVRIVRYEAKGYGKYVVIRHPNGLETIYGHMSKQLVEENQEVRAGQPIGLGGSTGRSTGSPACPAATCYHAACYRSAPADQQLSQGEARRDALCHRPSARHHRRCPLPPEPHHAAHRAEARTNPEVQLKQHTPFSAYSHCRQPACWFHATMTAPEQPTLSSFFIV